MFNLAKFPASLPTNPQYHSYNFKLGSASDILPPANAWFQLISLDISAQSLTPAVFRIFLVHFLVRLSSNARHSFASFASSAQFTLPSWKTSGSAPKPLCEVVGITICNLVLQPPRLIFARKLAAMYRVSQQRWQLPEQSHQNLHRGDGEAKSARTDLQQSCRRKVSLRK